jgi:hypothetical protein
MAQASREPSENPILGTDQTSQAFTAGRYKFFTARMRCTKAGIPALSSTFLLRALSAVKVKQICEQF